MRALMLVCLTGLALAPLALVVAGGAEPRTPPDVGGSVDVHDVTALLAWGADLYALNCAVCHGATGGGLAEAKLAFPADHRNCTRCHRPNNRVVQPLTQPFIDNDMFSIGDPPALRVGTLSGANGSQGAAGADTPGELPGLAALAQPSAILAYVTATMPRYDPGRLTRDEYVAITAHLLALNGRVDEVAGLPLVGAGPP